jgi:hypothetical protein
MRNRKKEKQRQQQKHNKNVSDRSPMERQGSKKEGGFAKSESAEKGSEQGAKSPNLVNSALSSRDVVPQNQNRAPKIGFEFETGNALVGKEVKVPIYDGPAIRVEPDSTQKKGNNLEFVIHEASTLEESLANLNEAIEFARVLSANRKNAFEAREVGDKQLVDSTKFHIVDGDWVASPQITQGVLLSEMVAYLREAYDRSTRLEKSSTVDRMEELVKDGIYRGADDDVDPSVIGFLVLFATSLHELHNWEPGPDNIEGPKNAFVAMPRTDFRTMVQSLGLDEAGLATLKTNMEKISETIASLESYVIQATVPHGDEHNPERDDIEVTVQGWIDSIVSEQHTIEIWTNDGPNPMTAISSDEMSPPPLFRELDPRYSMGAMGMDGPFVLLEERETDPLGTGGNVPMSKWEEFVEVIFVSRQGRWEDAGGDGS